MADFNTGSSLQTYDVLDSYKFSIHELAFKKKIEYFEVNRTGTVAIDIQNIIDSFTQIGFSLILHSKKVPTISFKKTGENSFVAKKSVDPECIILVNDVSVFSYRSNRITILSLDKDIFDKSISIIEKNFTDVRNEGNIKVVINTHGDLSLGDISNVGRTLQPDNYLPSVLKDFDSCLANMSKDDPFGRLYILSGPAGTGKTSLLNHLAEVSPYPKLYVPNSVLPQIVEPSFMQLLIDEKIIAKSPIILLLEDADGALVPREEGQSSLITDMLNLTDGIIGRGLNLHIVTTTNSNHVTFDKAITRPGRLFKHIKIDAFDVERANALLLKFNPNPKMLFKKPATLAQIYAVANGYDPDPIPDNAGMGFK